MPVERLRATLANTTQSAEVTHTVPLMCHMSARFKHLRYPRLAETVCVDTIPVSVTDIDGYNGVTVFFGERSKMLNLYPYKRRTDFLPTYKQFVTDEGVPSHLHSDGAKEFFSKSMKKLHAEYNTTISSTEPNHPWQNPVETQIVNRMKAFERTIMDTSGAPDNSWLYAWRYFAYIHNRYSSNGKTDVHIYKY